MKSKLGILIMVMGLTVSNIAQTKQQPDATAAPSIASITGKWHGKIKQQPAVDILLKSDDGKLSGTVIFYPIRGVSEEAPPEEKIEVSLIDPEFKDRTLAFKIKQPDGRVQKLEMNFVSETEAILKPQDDRNVPEEMIVKMSKVKEATPRDTLQPGSNRMSIIQPEAPQVGLLSSRGVPANNKLGLTPSVAKLKHQ